MVRVCFLAFCLFLLAGCNGATSKSGAQGDQDSVNIAAEDSLRQIVHTLKMDDGSTRIFYQVEDEGLYQLWTKLTSEDDTQAKRIYTPLDLAGDGDDFYEYGLPDPIIYTVSPDNRSLYVVASIHANSNGWVFEYKLYKIDCATLDVKMIDEGAAIEAKEDGFTIVRCRCTNDSPDICVADQIWVMHDEHIDWDGKVLSADSEEYDYDEMERRYTAPDIEYWYLRGFQHCPWPVEDEE